MKAITFALYTLAFLFDGAGVVLVIRDTIRDLHDVRDLRDAYVPPIDANHRIVMGGEMHQGVIAAAVNSNQVLTQRIQDFATKKLGASWLVKWRGVILIILGTMTGYAGNLFGLFGGS